MRLPRPRPFARPTCHICPAAMAILGHAIFPPMQMSSTSWTAPRWALSAPPPPDREPPYGSRSRRPQPHPPLSPARLLKPPRPPRPTGTHGSRPVHPRRRSCDFRLGVGTDRRPALARKLHCAPSPPPLPLVASAAPRSAPGSLASRHRAPRTQMSPTAWTAPALGAQRLSAARPRTLIWFAVGAAAVPPTFVPSARPLLNPPRRALHPRPPCHGRSRTGPYPALSGTSPPASAHACGQVARRPRAAALPMRQSFEAWTAPALGAQRLFAARPRTLVWFAVGAAAAPPPLSPARPLNPPRRLSPIAPTCRLSRAPLRSRPAAGQIVLGLSAL